MSRSLLLAILLAACGRAQRGEPTGPPVVPDTRAESHGETLFHQFCYQCHPGGETGLGPSLNDRPLPAIAIKTQIRKGLGAMPAFSDQLLSDGDVSDIAAYVQDLRATPGTYSARR